jgi:hypothetical protein
MSSFGMCFFTPKRAWGIRRRGILAAAGKPFAEIFPNEVRGQVSIELETTAASSMACRPRSVQPSVRGADT